MLCKEVVPLLSEYFDEVLDRENAVQVSQHLGQCISCRKELNSYAALHNRLRSLSQVQAPEYLRRLVQRRISGESWRVRVKNELARYWSIIRTTEGMWYVTRAMGTVVTSVLFLLTFRGIFPFYDVNAQAEENRKLLPAYSQEVVKHVQSRLGMLPPRNMYTHKSDPAINYQYLDTVGRSISENADDYDFSVLMYVDRSGQAKGQTVVEHPSADSFLTDFNKVVSSSRFVPAKKNGEAVPSHVVLMFSKISVWD
jgi:hypothetical protein